MACQAPVTLQLREGASIVGGSRGRAKSVRKNRAPTYFTGLSGAERDRQHKKYSTAPMLAWRPKRAAGSVARVDLVVLRLELELNYAGIAPFYTRLKTFIISEVTLPDGLDALRAELDLPQIMRLIERTARWVDPDTFRLLPLWYPEHARGTYLYKGNWSEPQLNKNRQTNQREHKREGNVSASKALAQALGLRDDDRPNWSCCHIWSVDDVRFQMANIVVRDRCFFLVSLTWSCCRHRLKPLQTPWSR